MKKTLGMIASVSLIAIGVISANESNCGCQVMIQDKNCSYLDTASALGFSIPSTYSPRFHINRQTYYDFRLDSYEYKIKNKLQYYTEVYDCLFRSNNDPSLFLYAYRITTDPHKGREWGFLGIGSYGEDWRTQEIKTTIQLYSNQNILNYAPLNSPSRYTTSIGFGVEAGTGGVSMSASASVSYDHSELNVYSNTSTGLHLYQTIYAIKHNVDTSYNTHQSYHYGLLYFKLYNAPYTTLRISHDVSFYGGSYGNYTDTRNFGYNYMTY